MRTCEERTLACPTHAAFSIPGQMACPEHLLPECPRASSPGEALRGGKVTIGSKEERAGSPKSHNASRAFPQLAATEIVRRCERRIVGLVREGQDRGEILRKGQRADLAARADVGGTRDLPRRIGDVVDESEWRGGGNNFGIRHLESTDDRFEQAIEEAKAS